MLLRYFDYVRTLLFKDDAPAAASAAVSGLAPIPVAMAYLRYNQQHNAGDSGMCGYILATLLRVSSYRSPDRAPAIARPLFAAIEATTGLRAFLDETRTEIADKIIQERNSARDARERAKKFGYQSKEDSPDSRIHRDAAQALASESANGERMKPALHRFMLEPGNAGALWTYIQTVPTAQWPTWTESRRNATSHRRLHDFYRLAFE
jgi:hypothetical protein